MTARRAPLTSVPVECTVNGSPVAVTVPVGRTLLDLLRDDLGLTGAKRCCNVQVCGSCTVLVDGEPVSSCTYLAFEARGRKVETIEGLAHGDSLDPLQEAFVRGPALQCGFCTPGMIMAAKALLRERPAPTPREVAHHLDGNICRCTGYTGIVEAVRDAAGGLEAAAGARPRGEGAGRPAPSAAPRLDAPDKVTGRARFTADLRLPDMAHAVLLQSPVPHARVVRLDVRAAAAAPGVLAVLTGGELRPYEERERPADRESYCMALERVRFEGEVLAAVAAATPEEAREAVKRIDLEYEPLDVVSSIDDALDPARAQAGGPPTVVWAWEYARGDAEAGFREADAVVEDLFDYPVNHHVAMEPHVCMAHADEAGARLWSSTRNMYGVRSEIARMFGYRLADVDVQVPFVGGAYGSRSYCRLEPIAVALSRQAGRPVRLLLSIDESFRVAAGHAVRVKLETGVRADGRLLARRIEVLVDTGAYADVGPVGLEIARHVAYRAPGPYRIPHLQIRAARVYTNKVPGAALRGYGAQNVAFAYESHMDQIAARLGIDPVELRRRNLLRRGEALYEGALPADGDYLAALEKAAEAIRWHEQPPPGSGRGKGIAVALKNSGGVRTFANAILRLHPDETVSLLASVTESGQGARTVLAQVAAEVLGLPVAAFTVVHPQTGVTPFDQLTGSSGTTLVTGRAVELAARDLREQVLALAAELLRVAPGTLRLSEGAVVSADGRTVRLGALMRQAFGRDGGELIGVGRYRRVVQGACDRTLFYEFAVGAAEVEVDRETGAVKVLRYVAVSDVGRAINRPQVEGQDRGGAMMGIGQALFEELVYEDGQLLNGSLVGYRVPGFRDVPPLFESILIENGDGPGPFGAKGAGEGGLLPVAPAIANAVSRAAGARVRRLPLTPERVWAALRAAAPPEPPP